MTKLTYNTELYSELKDDVPWILIVFLVLAIFKLSTLEVRSIKMILYFCKISFYLSMFYWHLFKAKRTLFKKKMVVQKNITKTITVFEYFDNK